MKKLNARKLTSEEIDVVVEEEANKDSAWTAPISVHRSKAIQLRLPGAMSARINFLAKLHHAKKPADWVEDVLRERLEFEESALGNLKQALQTSS